MNLSLVKKSILAACFLATHLCAAPHTHSLRFDHQSNSLLFVDTMSPGDFFSLELSRRTTDDSVRGGVVFTGYIEAIEGEWFLVTDERKINLRSVPENWNCAPGSEGEFMLLDICHPKNCGFLYGGNVISSTCSAPEQP